MVGEQDLRGYVNVHNADMKHLKSEEFPVEMINALNAVHLYVGIIKTFYFSIP